MEFVSFTFVPPGPSIILLQYTPANSQCIVMSLACGRVLPRLEFAILRGTYLPRGGETTWLAVMVGRKISGLQLHLLLFSLVAFPCQFVASWLFPSAQSSLVDWSHALLSYILRGNCIASQGFSHPSTFSRQYPTYEDEHKDPSVHASLRTELSRVSHIISPMPLTLFCILKCARYRC